MKQKNNIGKLNNIIILLIVLILFSLIIPSISALSISETQLVAGHSLTINLEPENFNNYNSTTDINTYRLYINDGVEQLRYNGDLTNQIIYVPQNPGIYNLLLVSLDGSSQELSFQVEPNDSFDNLSSELNNLTGSSLYDNSTVYLTNNSYNLPSNIPFDLFIDKDEYVLGESVLITASKSESGKLIIETPQGQVRYQGMVEGTMPYITTVEGKHKILFYQNNNLIIELDFNVRSNIVDFINDSENSDINDSVNNCVNDFINGSVNGSINSSNIRCADNFINYSYTVASDSRDVLFNQNKVPDIILSNYEPDMKSEEWVTDLIIHERPSSRLSEKTLQQVLRDVTYDEDKVSIKGKQNVYVLQNKPEGFVETITTTVKQTVSNVFNIEKDFSNQKVEAMFIDDDFFVHFINLTINDSVKAKSLKNNLNIKLNNYEEQVKAFAIDPTNVNFENASIYSVAKGSLLYKCPTWNYDTDTCTGGWEFYARIAPGMVYEIPLTLEDPAFIEVGLVTVNTNKPLYHPGETANIIIPVLDTQGYLVSNASVNISITTPNNITTILTANESSIGIYETNYTTSSFGIYALYVEGVGENVSTNFSSYFEVRDNYEYDIIRTTLSSVDPWKDPVKMSINISSTNLSNTSIPTTFNFVDKVPKDAIIFGNMNHDYIINNTKYLVWDNVSSGNVIEYYYALPKISPELYYFESFINYTLNNTVNIFEEARPWFVAADPTVDTNRAGDIDMTTLGDNIIVFAWYDTGSSDVSFEIWYTNGTQIVDETDIDTNANADSRVAVAAINSTHFVITYIDGIPDDLFHAIYDITGSQILGVTQLDSNVGTNVDVGVTELGSNYAICNINDADNDADYRIYNNAGTQTTGESNIDGNSNPGATGQNIADCAAVSSTRWVYGYFDDQSNDITIALMSSAGAIVSGPTDADGNAGETGQVAVATMPDQGYSAVVWYDNSNSDIYWRIDDVSGDSFSPVLSTTRLDANAGTTSRVSIDEFDYKGTPYWVVSWQDTNAGDIKAGVYSATGTQITAPFSAITTEDGTYRIIDVEGGNNLLDTGLCTGVFVLGYSDVAGTTNFEGFWYNGSSWDGNCVNFAPNQTNPLLVSSTGFNETTDNLICYNQSTDDYEGDSVRNIYNWYINGSTFEILNTPFDASSSSTTPDYSGNNNDGTVTGATWNSSGKLGGSYSFDGNNDYITFQGDDLSTTNNPFTVEFWFNPTSTIDSGIANSVALVEKREGGGGNDWLIDFNSGDAGRMRIRSYTGNIQTQTATWTADTWYHIAFVYDGNTNSTIYVDGVVDNRNNDYDIGTLTQSTEDIYVGTRYDQSEDFSGKIDELRIYDRALSANQIEQHYNLNYTVIVSDETNINDDWSCSVTPNDGFSSGFTNYSNNITILAGSGDPPTIESVNDYPDPAVLGSNINITAVVSDPDNNIDKVLVGINGINYTMTNSTGKWWVQIDTTGFSTGTIDYTIYANDTASKTATPQQGTITLTNSLTTNVITNQESYYIEDNVTVNTTVTLAGSGTTSNVVTDIIKVNVTNEQIKSSWWDTTFKNRVRFTINDTSSVTRTNYWTSVPVVIDGNCDNNAHNNSLRLIDDNNQSINFLEWNVTTCPDSSYTQSLWITFRLNLTADDSRNFYLYSDNSTGKIKTSTSQAPWRIIYVTGNPNSNNPDTTSIESEYDSALATLGISSTGFYDTLTTSDSSNDVADSDLLPYAYVHYASAAQYTNSISQSEALNLYEFVNQSGSTFLTGQDLGYDADDDGWIYNNVFRNLTHMSAGWDDDAGDPTSMTVTGTHPVTSYLGPSGSTFTVNSDYFDGYTATIGPNVYEILEWVGSAQPEAGTANDGLTDTSCNLGKCGKTVYFAGILIDNSGSGISTSSDREDFITGTIDWFLNNNSIIITYTHEQEFYSRQTGSTDSNGLLSLIFNSSIWNVGTYAATSYASKTIYESDINQDFFTMSIDYSNYPNITSVVDTPDPVPSGLDLNITAVVSDPDNNLNRVWVNINGTNYTMSNTTLTNWNISINTTGFALGELTYTVYANDTQGNDATPVSGTVIISNSFQVSVSTDKSEYIIGETVTTTSQSFLGFQPTDATITVDIIKGISDTRWWDTSWKKRKPFNLTTPDSTERINEIIRLNLTGLNLTSCTNELRIISGATSETFKEIPFTVESGNNNNWCYVRFLANISGTTEVNHYHVYYNNSAATNPSYSTIKSSYINNADFETTSYWTYYETETADGNGYSTAQSNSPNQSYHIYSGNSGTIGNYAQIYQDISLPCVGCSIRVSAYNRLESAGTTADAFRAQIIMNSSTISNVGTPASVDSPEDWAKRSGNYNTQAYTERLYLRLLTEVTFTGGSYGQRDVYWDDADIVLNNPATFSLGNEQEWTARDSGISNSGTGLLNLLFNSQNYTNVTYSAVSLAEKTTYNNDSDYTTFLMIMNTSGYPTYSYIDDSPDPVTYGSDINFTVNVSDIGGISDVWIIIDGTTRYDLSNSIGDQWTYTLTTTGYNNGTHNYVVYANDTDNNIVQNGTYTFDVMKHISVTITGDKPSYTTGDIAHFITEANLAGPLVSGTTTTDIIFGSKEKSWWDIDWQRRMPLTISEPNSNSRTNTIVEINVTNLGGNISSCNELRVIDYKNNESGVLLDGKIFSGDDSTWCLLRFYANISVSESSNNRIFVYYNNTGVGAQSTSQSFQQTLYDDDGENSTLRSSWTRDPLLTDGASSGWWGWDDPENYQIGGVDAQPADDVTGGAGVYALFTGPTGDNSGTGAAGDVDGGQTTMSSDDIDLSGWGGVNISFYWWFYSNDNGGNNDDTCALRASTNSGTSYDSDIMVVHDDDLGADTDAYNSWTQAGYDLSDSVSTFNNQFQLLADADDYGDGDVMECGFDEFIITGYASDVSATLGGVELFIQRTTNTTNSSGESSSIFDTTGYGQGNYVAVSLVEKAPYDSGVDGFPFTISPDAPPTVTLTSPADLLLTNQTSITFQCSAVDDFNLVNISLYNDVSGSWKFNGTSSASGTADSASFPRTISTDGIYYWNCEAYDNISQSSFASANKSFTLDTTPPDINLYYPADGETIRTSSVLFSYDVSDLHDVTSCNLLIDGSINDTDNSITESTPQYFANDFADGIYTWAVKCTDETGNAFTTSTKSLTITKTNITLSGLLYESSSYGCIGTTCAINLLSTRNASTHSFVNTTVIQGSTITVEAASQFMGSNGAYIPSGFINFSGEYFTNPLSQGLISWQLYSQDTSLTRTLICQDLNNPLFSSLQGSCSTSSIYLEPDKNLMLIMRFTNDESHSISFTHYWDALRNSFVNLTLMSVGFINASITYPTTGSMNVNQGSGFIFNCTVECNSGTCVNTNVYAEYNPGSGYVNVGATTPIKLNGSQNNPVSLGNLSNGSSATATFNLIGNETGSYELRCKAGTVAENYNTEFIDVNVGDNTPPVVELQTPLNNTFTNLDPVPFVIFVNDSSNIDNCSIIINGSQNQSSTFINVSENNTISVSLATGTYSWSAICYDDGALSTTASETRIIKVDTIPPAITINYPINLSLDKSTVIFNWTITENGPVAYCNITINNVIENSSMLATPGTPHTYEQSNFDTGVHYWNVSCWDQANTSITSETSWFNITDSAPTVSLIYPGVENSLNTSTIIFRYLPDDNNGLQYCSVYLDGQKNNSNTTLIDLNKENNITVSGIADGYHNWSVECNDTGGQSYMPSVRWFTLDSTPPHIELITPTIDQTFTSTSNVTISFNATDSLSTNLSCYLTLNGAMNQSVNTTSGSIENMPLNNLADGTYNWNVTCEDEINNTNVSETRLFTINNSPELSLISPLTGDYAKANVTFTYYVDDNDEIANCSIYIDSSFNDSNTEITEGSNNQFVVNDLSEGSHNWYVICYDSGIYKNYNQTSIETFTVDITDPHIDLNDPQDAHIINSTWALLNFTATDNYASSMNCNITYDGFVNNTVSATDGTPYTYNLTNLANGWHYWNITCADDATNINTSLTRSFYINVPPTIARYTPADITFNNSYNWTFLYTPIINNPFSELAYFENCSLYINGELNKTDFSPTRDVNNTFNITNVGEGEYNWSVYCIENSGNEVWTSNWTFIEDRTPPQPNITTANMSWFSTVTPTILFRIEDNFNYNIDYQFYVDDVADAGASGSTSANSPSADSLSTLSEGIHTLILQGIDQPGNAENSSEVTIYVDFTDPIVTLNSPESGNITANSTVKLNFTFTDNLASNLTCRLYLDGSLNNTYTNYPNGSVVTETLNVDYGLHTWYVRCTDYASNTGTSQTWNFTVPQPDLFVNDSYVVISNYTPIEGQAVVINATIFNIGQSSSGDVTVQFWLGEPVTGIQLGLDQIINLDPGENITLQQAHTAIIGSNNIAVVVDTPLATNGSVSEENETNNRGDSGFTVGFYDIFSGESNDKLNVDNSLLSTLFDWNLSNSTGSNLFVTDIDSSVDFNNLQALSRDTSDVLQMDDFEEADAQLLGTNVTDSINRTWRDATGSIIETTSYTVFGTTINNVPIINSTNTTNFKTGILWDASDGGTEYDGTQDLIFISLFNEDALGSRGTYDYEIRVPATLREYQGVDDRVVFYAELK